MNIKKKKIIVIIIIITLLLCCIPIKYNIPTKSLSNIPIILSKEAITSASESFKSRIAVEEQGKIRSSERVSNQVQFEYYDVTEKTTYLITYTEITDDIGAKYITETVSPIK